MNRLLDYPDIWLIGGGGKTTLMFKLAAAWAERGERTICATTTKIWIPTPEQCSDLRVGQFSDILAVLHDRPASLVTVANRIENGKCLGFSAEETFSLKTACQRLVVEADGSAGRPVKGHAAHEPQIATGAACVVAVVGSWCVGAPLDTEHVHRPERFSAITGRPLGEPVAAADVAGVILGETGWLSSVPAGAAFYVVVTGHDSEIASALAEHSNSNRLAGIYRCLHADGLLQAFFS
jgi:probable selenium-dependent hydroxylase accessory protein YqeC